MPAGGKFFSPLHGGVKKSRAAGRFSALPAAVNAI